MYYNSCNVGIRLDNPSSKLHVNGDTRLDGELQVSGNTNLTGNLNVGGSFMVEGNTISTYTDSKVESKLESRISKSLKFTAKKRGIYTKMFADTYRQVYIYL